MLNFQFDGAFEAARPAARLHRRVLWLLVAGLGLVSLGALQRSSPWPGGTAIDVEDHSLAYPSKARRDACRSTRCGDLPALVRIALTRR